jgi:hypothetical protein
MKLNLAILLTASLAIVGCSQSNKLVVTNTYHESSTHLFVVEAHTSTTEYRLVCDEEYPNPYGNDPCFYVQAGNTYHINERQTTGSTMDIFLSLKEQPGETQIFKIEQTGEKP